MKNHRKAVLFILVIFGPYLADARKSGGGGGGSRGGSAARSNPAPPPAAGGAGAGHPPMAGGGGGFHGGAMPGSNARPPSGGGPGHFGGGSGPGSARSGSAFKTALAGAALGTVGGLVAFEAGKAIIHSFDKPFQHDGRSYAWGDEYIKKRPGEIQCRMAFESLIQQSNPSTTTASSPTTNGTHPTADQALAQATFPNGTRPKQIVWVCKANEECCGTDCCPKQNLASTANHDSSSSVLGTIGKVILIIIVVGFLLCCCCALIAYKFCRSIFDSCMPSNNNQNQPSADQSKYEATPAAGQQYPQQPQAQAYPMQPYPGSNNYPAQPQPPNAYPPAPGYYENKY